MPIAQITDFHVRAHGEESAFGIDNNANLGRTPVSVCPSTSYQVFLDTRPESPPKLIAEPPALQLHTWTDETIVSHTAYIDFPAEPIDLRPLMGNWDERRDRTRRGLRVPKVVRY